MVLARWKVVELCRPTRLLNSARPMPSRWRATSSRIAKARPSDCTPTLCRSSASASTSECKGSTSRAISARARPAGLSVFVFVGVLKSWSPGGMPICRSYHGAARHLSTITMRVLQIEQHHALFRHVADRIARAFAADAGILDAAIGELIGAPGRGAVEDDP